MHNTTQIQKAVRSAKPAFDGFNPDQPLVYRWEITAADGSLLGVYVGKAKNGAERPLKAYLRNVTKLLANKPYQKSKPGGFRKVHRALAKACQEGHQVTLTFLCNATEGKTLDQAEKHWINVCNSDGALDWQLNQTKKS